MPRSQVQRISGLKIALGFVLSISLWLVLFSIAKAEVIHSFDVEIEIQEDSSFLVTETIQYDFVDLSRHGIFRKVKNSHAQPTSTWYKERLIDIQLVSVTRNGSPEPYTIEEFAGLSVRIGDPEQTISGPHTYKLVYLVNGGMSVYPNLTELYWNVTGSEWPVVIEQASAKVVVGPGVLFAPSQHCYEGVPGTRQPCQARGVVDDYVVFESGEILPGEEFTFAQAVFLSAPSVILEKINWVWFIALGLLIWSLGFGIWAYRWRFAYRSSKSIIPQYEPYADFKPMFTGVLFDGRLDPKDISAGIVYLAQQGFISIEQTTEKVLFFFGSTDYKITLLRQSQEAATWFQRQLLELLFGENSSVGKKIKLSELKTNYSKQRANQKILQLLRKAVVKDLISHGFWEQRVTRLTRNGLLVFVGWFAFAWLVGFDESLFVSVIGLVLTLIIFLVFANERRTTKGYEAKDHLEGFKDFLSVTEKERYKFHNAPAPNPQQFMEYLPYAIAFGVEKKWAEVFRDIQVNQPSWYSSTTGDSFSPAVFSASLSAFSTTFASSTGSSGSSGGGSAGGGSGGGGGGSW